MAYGEILSDKITTSDGVSSAGLYGFKNRIINGAMVIDQRNAGASVTVNTGSQTFSVDRWFGQATSSSGVFTVQQSTTVPSGFKNSLIATVSTTDSSLAGTDLYLLGQSIEGVNVADLAWGTASAATVTLSFWVRSSITGTFGGALINNAANRSYPFTYTITSANTWEKETITIAGDTSGTWLTDTSVGLRLYLGLGVGATYSGTAGAWAGATYYSATGATNLMANSGATFYITGVQLEKGSTATSFDYLDYGRSLIQCQRYYISGKAPRARNPASSTQTIMGQVCYPVVMRASPTVTNSAGAGPDTGAGEYGFSTQESVAATSAGSNITYTASAEL